MSMRDETRASLPDAHVASAFDAEHYDFEDARGQDTSLVLTPIAAGVAPGVSAVVKSSGTQVLADGRISRSSSPESGLVYNRERPAPPRRSR